MDHIRIISIGLEQQQLAMEAHAARDIYIKEYLHL